MSEKLSILQPVKPSTLNYSFRELEIMEQKGLLDFKLPIQRGLKWKNTKERNDQSLLIFSMLINEPIGVMKCNHADEVYHFTDGIQRMNTVLAFMRGLFELKGIPLYQDEFTNEIIDLIGKRFDQLPKDLQEKITSYKPIIFVTENASEAQQAYSFKATNNGMPLTNAEKADAEIKDQETIIDLASHKLLDIALSATAHRNRDDRTIIKNMWAIFNMEEPSFLDKFLKPAIVDATFTQDTKDKITAILDRLNFCYELFKKQASSEKDKKIKKRQKAVIHKIFSKKAHIPTLSKVVLKSIQDGISEQQFAEWLWHFFNTDTGSTLSQEYNNNAIGGSASVKAVKTRMFEAMKDYEKFINNVEIEPESVSESIEAQDSKDTTKQPNEPEKVPEAEQQQSESQITFDEAQAKQNEQVYNDKQTKRSHHKK